MPLLDLTPDELLSTTRAVRRRLDLTRPVEPDVLEECVRLAVQAPTSTNTQNWHFVVVTDAAKRAALAELYLRSWIPYNGGRAPGESTGHGLEPPRGTSARGARARHPVHHGAPRGPRAGGPRVVLRVDHPGGMELPARRPRARTGQRLDDPPSRLRARGGRDPRHPLRGGHADRADPGRLHDRDGLQAGARNPLETVLHWQTW